MKNLVLLFFSISLLSSCRNEEEKSNYNGNLANQITGVGIGNATINFHIYEIKGTGIFSYSKVYYTSSSKTNADGNFSVSFPSSLKSNQNAYLFIEKGSDDFTTSFQDNISLKNLDQNSLKFLVRNWEYLKVKLKNTNPNNEAFVIDYFAQNNVTEINAALYKIINYGIKNEPYTYPADDNGLNPYWIGNNVNSELFYKIQNGSTYGFSYRIKQNGVWKEYRSQQFPTISGKENIYEFNY